MVFLQEIQGMPSTLSSTIFIARLLNKRRCKVTDIMLKCIAKIQVSQRLFIGCRYQEEMISECMNTRLQLRLEVFMRLIAVLQVSIGELDSLQIFPINFKDQMSTQFGGADLINFFTMIITNYDLIIQDRKFFNFESFFCKY